MTSLNDQLNDYCCARSPPSKIIFQVALTLVKRMRREPVVVPSTVAPQPVATNFVGGTGDQNEVTGPILLLHGFDSSLLEWRRLVPELEEMGADVYAVDILGWGFTETEGVLDFGAGEGVFLGTILTRWHKAGAGRLATASAS